MRRSADLDLSGLFPDRMEHTLFQFADLFRSKRYGFGR